MGVIVVSVCETKREVATVPLLVPGRMMRAQPWSKMLDTFQGIPRGHSTPLLYALEELV